MASSDSAFCFVLTALTTWSSSAVSTSMFLKKLMVGADLGGFVLELVGDLSSRAQVLVASSLLTLGLLGSLHFNVVLDNVGPRGLGGFGFNLGNFVLDSSFTFHFRVHN
jgi:hypothetical protein